MNPLVIVNPFASGGRGGRLWDGVAARAAAHWPRLEVVRTTGPGHAEALAASLAGGPAGRAVLVVGGDGTVHEVVNGLAGAGWAAPLGVIPAGTGNDFARNAGIPLDPGAACARAAAEGMAARRVDLGRVRYRDRDGRPVMRVFMNSMSVGVSVAANALAHQIRRVLPGRACYPLGGLLALLGAPRGAWEASSGGRVLHRGRALNLTVANGAAFGAGLRISPDSRPDDGTLELVVLADAGRLRALRAFAGLGRGAHLRLPECRVLPLEAPLRLEAEGTMVLEMDGQEYGATGPVEVDVVPGALGLLPGHAAM